MKIRNGFVSNSSSSSFVIVGATLDKRLELSNKRMADIMNEFGVKYDPECIKDDFNDALYNEEFGFSYFGEEDIVGKVIATSVDYAMDETKHSFAELENIAHKVKKDVKKVLGLDIDIELITGERSC